MMNDWLTALCSNATPAVLVTVAAAQGSVPREAGVKMLVTDEAQFDTIGGGHLEWCACTFAREMLASAAKGLRVLNHVERFPLGPTLGQCCGGVVWLAFELIDTESTLFSTLQKRSASRLESWRLIALDSNEPASLFDNEGKWISGSVRTLPAGSDIAEDKSCRILDAIDGKRWLLDPCLPPGAQLFLFGAGHVGAAIVSLLGTLPCQVTWIDEREDQFPEDLPANVMTEATDTPEAVIDAAPEGASFLVMTHSHALDQQLAEAILRKPDIGWFGLIGSKTKRIQFERRLRARGIAEQRLTDMVCPIGIPGIEGKEPATIAVAVVAQLLQVWEKRNRAVVHDRAEPVTKAIRRSAPD
jgi:xanthine dehydrogenase accessory factor